MRQVAYRPGVEHDTRRLVSVLFGPFRAFQDAHPAALVGRGRADQDERQDHARAAHGEYVGDGVAGEERAEKHILSIFFRPNSIIRALRAPFPTAPRRARSQHARPRYSSPPSRSSATICVNHGLGAYQSITGVLFRVRAGAVRRMKCLRSTRARSP